MTTARLVLRRSRVDDAEAIFAAYATDPEVTRYLTWAPHAGPDETAAFLDTRVAAWETATGFAWTILRASDDEPMGMIDLRVDGSRAEWGYVLARRHWGAGYMSEALTAVRDIAFADPRVQRIQIVCDVDNPASARVMAKAGFVHEGVLRCYITHPAAGDVPRDCLCYSRVRADRAPRPPTDR